MKHLFACLIMLLLNSVVAFAQFAPSKVGTLLLFDNIDNKGKSTGTDTLRVQDIRKIGAETVTSVEVLNKLPENDDEDFPMDMVVKYRYNPQNGITQFVFIEGDALVSSMAGETKEFKKMEPKKQEEMMKKLKEQFHLKGQLSLPLKAGVKNGEKFASSELSMRMMLILSISMKTDNCVYGGTESVTTPAGTFQCIKLSYKLKCKAMGSSETNSMTQWFAPGVGLVKTIEYNDKGAVTDTTVLKAIL